MTIMKTIKILILTSVLLLTSVSCKKFVEDYYKDPNGITNTVVEQEMTAMMLENQFFHKADGLRMTMMWMNQATGADRQYLSLDDWNNATGDDFNGPWNEVYLTASHADILIKMADKDGNIVLRGLGKLYKAWAGGQAASLWGECLFLNSMILIIFPILYMIRKLKFFNKLKVYLMKPLLI